MHDFCRMNILSRNGSLLLTVLMVSALALFSGGCGVEPDRLVAMPLETAPAEGEWASALALRLYASGGATSIAADTAVDKDSVHKATASCHHGTDAPKVKVEAKAFYTPERLYLRFSWLDPTPDTGPSWVREGEGWKARSVRRDGLGILWGEAGKPFSCTSTCHLRDWRQAGARAFADYGMGAPEGRAYDFWVWRAGRDRLSGTVEDAVLVADGRRGDADGPFETPNSRRYGKGGDAEEGSFAEGDAPVNAVPSPEGLIPGYFTTSRAPGSLEVEGQGVNAEGRWTLTLSRALKGSDPADAGFTKGGSYFFGLALLDGVVRDHNAVARPIRLELVVPPPVRGGD